MLSLVKRLWAYISFEQKKQFLILLLAMVVVAMLEIITIGLTVPMVIIIAGKNNTNLNYQLEKVLDVLRTYISDSIIYESLVIIFCLLTITCGLLRVYIVWMNNKVSFSVGNDLSGSIYKKILNENYENIISKNSSQYLEILIVKINSIIYGVLLQIINILSSAIITSIIVLSLIVYSPKLILILLLSLAIIFIVLMHYNSKKLVNNSKKVSELSNKLIKTINESIGGIRDVIIDSNQKTYYKIYENINSDLRKSQGTISFISMSPRQIIEPIGMVLIILIAYVLASSMNGLTNALPYLVILALSLQKLIPLFQQMYSGYSTILGNKTALIEVIGFLSHDNKYRNTNHDSNKIEFKNNIKFSNVEYSYKDKSFPVFSKINIKVNKGDRIGIIGKSGSGKTTFADLFMGLLLPTSGSIEIDNLKISNSNIHAYQHLIAHVSQNVYLSDATISANIAFGVEGNKIDQCKLIEVSKKAKIDSYINTLPKKYETIVGERGAWLSGGQRQRIGIARALYKQAQIIILDEATSSLDSETEKEILSEINQLDKALTIITIAHRKSALRGCQIIYEVKNNQLSLAEGGYEYRN